ncbi:4Fe-4S binding protein (plasmid) [Thioclava sp. 'Guangxiensis']|uniref:ferredoxin family protein n=1 Tax=Thioclava sp. 'Guangxiensis' TaxID=3149044 RepID=UPI0032C4155E
MPHVVTDNCRNCRYTECVSVCPVACFHIGAEMLFIDPAGCIDCGGCVPVCPVGAIRDSFELGPEEDHWLAVNAEGAVGAPTITTPQPPLPTAESRRAELGLAG